MHQPDSSFLFRDSTNLPSPNRDAALARLHDFAPLAVDYSNERNYDRPGHSGVSRLSPALSRRLVTEAEVIAAVLAVHPFSKVEKFIQEVCWRTYWKGWLEMRPSIWENYRKRLADLQSPGELNRFQTKDLERAQNGETGIECFDHWVNELKATNYLHNHARMWFASIWIFTLKLPWELGAHFFYRHLLDADPASNTLGWRWVAGLHTLGKHYVARASNIRKFTEGRFDPSGQLNENTQPIEEDTPPPKANSDLIESKSGNFTDQLSRSGLILLGDDLSTHNLAFHAPDIISVAGGWNGEIGSTYELSPAVIEYSRSALADGLASAADNFNCRSHSLDETAWYSSVLSWVEENDLETIYVQRPAIGPWREVLDRLRATLPPTVALRPLIRPWDAELWPHAKAGFFKFRTAIPAVVDRLCR